ncbi:DNA binding protein, partial [Ascosphaera aggregata]
MPVAHQQLVRQNLPAQVNLQGLHLGQSLQLIQIMLHASENGIFNALSRNFLDAVQITILADKKNPSNVLETYTFTFSYNDSRLSGEAADDEVNSRLASINLNANGTVTEIPTSRTSARNGIEMIIRRLITLSTFLPRLPNDRFMEIHLFHKDCCPLDYFPPGFQPVSDERESNSLCYPEDDEWTTETQTCGTVNTGLHAVGVNVTSMKYRGTDQAGSDGIVDIPSTVSYSRRVAREEEIGVVIPASASSAIPRQMPSCEVSCREMKLAPFAPVVNSQLSTQARQDEVTKHLLERMALPSTPPSDIVPTQVKAHDLRTMIADDEEDTQVLRPQLSQADLSKLRKIERETHSKSANGQLNHDVACQCGWKGTDPNEKMLRCSFCGMLQHPVCYGFLHGDDASIPDVPRSFSILDPSYQGVLKERRRPQ